MPLSDIVLHTLAEKSIVQSILRQKRSKRNTRVQATYANFMICVYLGKNNIHKRFSFSKFLKRSGYEMSAKLFKKKIKFFMTSTLFQLDFTFCWIN